MYQDGEVFTYRSDRAPRPLARSVRPAAFDSGKSEPLAAAERLTRLETLLQRLDEESARVSGQAVRLAGEVAALTDQVVQLAAAIEELQAAQAASVRAVPAVAQRPALERPAPVQVAPIRVERLEEKPAPEPPPGVKVSLFAGGATEAILGQVKVIGES